jgi:hypothetical protein
MTPKNIALEPDVLEQVGKLAEAEGKTADELMNEAAVELLERRKTVGELRSFQSRMKRNAEAQGLKESDVPRLIAETRRSR